MGTEQSEWWWLVWVPRLFAAATSPPSSTGVKKINAPSPIFIVPHGAIGGSNALVGTRAAIIARWRSVGRSVFRSFEIRDGRPKFCPLTRITILFAGIVGGRGRPVCTKHVLELSLRRRRGGDVERRDGKKCA